MCALRPWCKVSSFYQRAMVCELYFEDVSVYEEAGEHCQLKAMIFVKRADITGDEIKQCDRMCPLKSVLQACDLSRQTCLTDVCPFNVKEDGKVFGNTHHEGSVRRPLCNRGYRPLNTNHVERRLCRPFNVKENGKVLGNTHHEGSVGRLLCNRGNRPLNTNHVDSRCKGGTWTNITTCISDSCTDNMHTFQRLTYLIPDFTFRDFQSTESRCAECGGHEVNLESSEEEQSVTGKMESFKAKGGIPFHADGGVFWLGIQVKVDLRVFRVHDNATVTYTIFGQDQPDRYGVDECNIVSNWYAGKWSNVPCSAQYFAVCELEA